MPCPMRSLDGVLCTPNSRVLTSDSRVALTRGSACPAFLLLKHLYTAPQHPRRFSCWLKKFQSHGSGRQEEQTLPTGADSSRDGSQSPNEMLGCIF